MFSDDQFSAGISEIDTPVLDDYEFFVQCGDVEIYRKYDATSGLYEYKCFGHLELNGDTMQQVYMDLEYRKQWDAYVKELYNKMADGVPFIYWNVNFPFPLSNRDYTYVRECRQMAENTWVILAKAHPTESLPEKKGIVRVNEYKQFLVIRNEGENRAKVFMHYFDNPGGSIPTWLINWAAKTGVPKFMSDMEKACAGYEKYIAGKS